MVVLHKSEVELKDDINVTQSKLMSCFGGNKWCGITSPDTIGAPAAGYCLWTKLQNVPFGFYWFKIRQICFEEREIIVLLKIVRSVPEDALTPSISSTSLTKTFSESVESLKSRFQTSFQPSSQQSAQQDIPVPVQDESQNLKAKLNVSPTKSNKEEKNIETPKPMSDKHSNRIAKQYPNMGDFVTFVGLLMSHSRESFIFLYSVCVATVNAAGKCVEFTGNFSLKFLHELNVLLRTVTPIILAVIELVGKLVGGLYLLIAMLFQKRPGPLPARQFMPQLQSQRPLQAIQYPKTYHRVPLAPGQEPTTAMGYGPWGVRPPNAPMTTARRRYM